MSKLATLTSILALSLAACATADSDPLDAENASFPKSDSLGGPNGETMAVLALVNDPNVTFAVLDDDARLNSRAAENIIAYRDGADALPGTADDDIFDNLKELDDVPYVGPFALDQLLVYAVDHGYGPVGGGDTFAIFSPQPYDDSHSAHVAELIDGAQHSLDIAMYSYSDATIADALEAAVNRGVKVRFIFETAGEDQKLTGTALESSKSARLEKIGINVRYVNKIMHHKFILIDGPRDDLAAADTGILASGSGNWSNGAATRYDENTVFLTGNRELNLRFQREFNHLWEHSRDFVWDATLPYELSGVTIEDSDIDDSPDAGVYFTSANFNVKNTTFSVKGANTVSDQLVAAINGATESIHIASGHLRSRPVSEALMAKKAADPSIDIRVYLDDQEYISAWFNSQQEADLADCLADATTPSQERKCTDKGYYFGYPVEQAGIDVRYKYYSYRWHYSYAVQMHHKYMIIDGDELWTGSYNLSDNAEHNTFENMMTFRGAAFANLIDSYEANFAALWETSRNDGTLDALTDQIENANPLPIVFEPMALTWAEVTDLKDLVRDNCPDINTDDFRKHPENHWVCYR